MSKILQFHKKEIINKQFYTFKRKLNTGSTYVLLPVAFAAGLWPFFGQTDQPTATSAVVWLFGILVALLLGIKGILQVSQESILIVPSIGIQLRTVYIIGTESTNFIPWSAVSDVIVNEAVVGFRIVHYLAILKRQDDGNSREIVPILLKSNLRLPEIKQIYCDIQKILN